MLHHDTRIFHTLFGWPDPYKKACFFIAYISMSLPESIVHGSDKRWSNSILMEQTSLHFATLFVSCILCKIWANIFKGEHHILVMWGTADKNGQSVCCKCFRPFHAPPQTLVGYWSVILKKTIIVYAFIRVLFDYWRRRHTWAVEKKM